MQSRGSGEHRRTRPERELVRPPPPDNESAPEADTGSEAGTRESMAERAERLDRKVAAAHSVMRNLPPTDARARLLSSAVLRRDEVLLDAVLSSLGDAWRDIIDMPAPIRRRSGRPDT